MDSNKAKLDALLQRILLEDEPMTTPTVGEGPRQGEFTESYAAASSSQPWQPEQWWWSSWEQTASSGRWWESSTEWWSSWERPAQREPTPSEVEAKKKAKTEKRLRQKAKKAEASINPADFKLGQVHLGDIRTAQKLWQIFPHDEDSQGPVLKFCGGINVPCHLYPSDAAAELTR